VSFDPAASRPLLKSRVRSVAKAIAEEGNEDVVLFCNTKQDATELHKELDGCSRITISVCPSDDSWARDRGPTFVCSTGCSEAGRS
jgi:agmatine/peptidylarginine deiminase